MRLRGKTVRDLAESKGVALEQLARAVERTGLEGAHAISAVGNWMRGSDHPRCKKADIERLAEALGVQPKDIARFTSEVRFHRGSPRKAKLLIDLVRGKKVDEALNMLAFTTKRAAVNVRKALSAAIADAERANADVTALVVAESTVSDGPRLKRFQPKDRGRAHPIIKLFSHITIGVEEKA